MAHWDAEVTRTITQVFSCEVTGSTQTEAEDKAKSDIETPSEVWDDYSIDSQSTVIDQTTQGEGNVWCVDVTLTTTYKYWVEVPGADSTEADTNACALVEEPQFVKDASFITSEVISCANITEV